MSEQSPRTPAVYPGDQTLRRKEPPSSSAGLEHIDHPGSFIAGGLLGIVALKRRDLAGLFAAGVGIGLLYRGARQNGLLDGDLMRRLLHTRARRLVPFERQLIVDRPPSAVYRFWRDLENLAVYLPRIRDVRIIDDTRSHWQLKLTDALHLEWTAELVEDEPGRRMVWRTTEDSDLYHDGWVTFEPLRDGQSTRVTIRLYIRAPGGDTGAKLLAWLQDLPLRYFSADLQTMRSVLETNASSSPE